MPEETFEERMAREKRERKERGEANHDFARSIAKVLKFEEVKRRGDDDDMRWNPYFEFTDGNVQISFSGMKGKFHVGSTLIGYDYSKHGRISTPSINVSRSKSPEVIARDIERRLLPELRKVQAELNGKNSERDARARELGAIAAELIEASDGILEPAHSDSEIHRRLKAYHMSSSRRIEVDFYGEEFDMTLANLTKAEVIRILCILKDEWKKK